MIKVFNLIKDKSFKVEIVMNIHINLLFMFFHLKTLDIVAYHDYSLPVDIFTANAKITAHAALVIIVRHLCLSIK